MADGITEQDVKNFLKSIGPGKSEGLPLKLARGEVTVDGSVNFPPTVDCTIGGGTVEIEMNYMDSYSPTVGDDVLILIVPGDRYCLGKLA